MNAKKRRMVAIISLVVVVALIVTSFVSVFITI